MPLEYYVKAIEKLQRQLYSLGRPITLSDVYPLYNTLATAQQEHPEYFQAIISEVLLENTKVLVWYCSASAFTFWI